jgi:hypothetical protein
MVYSPQPPYEILSNKLIDFPMMQRLRRFARYWDLTANSGNFVETVPLLWRGEQSPFWRFLAYTDWVYARLRRTHQIALATLAESLFDFLIQSGIEREEVVEALDCDWRRIGRKEELPFLAGERETLHSPSKSGSSAKRQSRHLLAS